MPQLDFSTFAPQLVWLAISFIALYFLMARVALPRIATVLEQRRDRIAHDLDEAERSRQETEAALAAYEASLAAARAKAHEIAQANRDRLSAEIETERKAVDATAAAKGEQAEKAINAAKAAALGELGTVAADVTAEIVASLVGGKWPKNRIDEAVAASMKG